MKMSEIRNHFKKWIYWFLLGVAIIIVYKALDNFGDSFNYYIYGNTLDFEKIDVVIRCYVLRHTINVVVDELKEQFKEEL